MTTKGFKDWLKQAVGAESITMGKLDTAKTETVCVYGGRTPVPKIGSVGGGSQTYGVTNFRILVRWGANADTAEARARAVYASVNNVHAVIGTSTAWLVPLNEEPVSLGTDDKGIYEYSIDVKVTFER